MIYFNANGTTEPCEESIEETVKWMYKYDTNDKDNKDIITKTKKYLYNLCNIKEDDYSIIFTSGASESNSTIIRSIVDSYIESKKVTPHIIISEIEHKSIINCCETLYNLKLITYTKIKPQKDGRINPYDVEYEIKSNTCLISIMYSNNEIGSVNDVKTINKIAKKYNIPFHCDCVQMFGKINIDVNNFTSISMSFHKLYYLKGIGLLIINKHFMCKNNLKCIIAGTQQDNYRGGTLPTYLIAGSLTALKNNFKNRDNKNKHLLSLKKYFLEKLRKYFSVKFFCYKENCDKKISNNYEEQKITSGDKLIIVIFGNDNIDSLDKIMPNTCLISIYSPNVKFCNMIMKQDLIDNDVHISIGSNCNADNPDASHVVSALNLTPILKRGTLRISFSDNNTKDEIDSFIKIFIKCIDKQVDLNNILIKKIPFLIKKIRFKTHIRNVLTDKAVPDEAYY